jgi:hypothetical protein
MVEEALAFLPDLDAEADVIALGAADPPGLDLGLVQNVAGVEVGNPHPPGVFAFRQHHPAAFVEIEAQPLGAGLGRHRCGRWIGRLGRRRIP